LKELFDQPERYDEFLKKGIGITGNDKLYFIRGRLELMTKYLSDSLPSKILDFGCGTGETSNYLAKLFPKAQITATDESGQSVDFAREKNENQSLNFQYFEDWKNSSETFDLVYINCVFHHIQPAERQEIMDLIFQKTKIGGQIWIFENNPLNPGTRLAMYLNPFDKGVVKIWPGELYSQMKTSGFQGLEKWFLFYFPQWLSFFRFLEKWGEKLPFGGQYAISAKKQA
jgi:SAM-dependent methyltransferase